LIDVGFLSFLEDQLVSVEKKMVSNVEGYHPDLIAALEHLMSAGGKRIRPIITLLMGTMLGADEGKLISLSASIELLHTATLVHDDLIDGALLRRGNPTLNSHIDIDWKVSGILECVAVKRDTALMAEHSDLPNGVDSADLIIGTHDRDQGCPLAEETFHFAQNNLAGAINWQGDHLKSMLLGQVVGCDLDRWVFHGGDDNLIESPQLSPGKGCSPQCQVVTLRTARGEDDLLREGAQVFGELAAGFLQGGFRFLSEEV